MAAHPKTCVAICAWSSCLEGFFLLPAIAHDTRRSPVYLASRATQLTSRHGGYSNIYE